MAKRQPRTPEKSGPVAETPAQVPAPGGTQPEGEGKPRKHYNIDIYRAWCKECGLCAAFCPQGCIEMDENGRPQITHPERCTGCGWCELHCPDFAISVRECPKALPQEEAD
jgi:2-oxoglutarate ferredoxin oxidoreductase subunit delta